MIYKSVFSYFQVCLVMEYAEGGSLYNGKILTFISCIWFEMFININKDRESRGICVLGFLLCIIDVEYRQCLFIFVLVFSMETLRGLLENPL